MNLYTKKIRNSKTLSEVIETLLYLKSELEIKNDLAFEKDFTRLLTNEIKMYRKKFQKENPSISHFFLYPEDKPFLYVSYLVEELKKETSLSNILDFCIQIFSNCFKERRGSHASFEEEIDLIHIAEEKFHFLQELQFNERNFDLFNLPFSGMDSDTSIQIREYPKKIVFELLLLDQQKKDRSNLYMFATLLGRILNFALIDSIYEGPYGLIRDLKKMGFSFQAKDKDEASILFSNLFALALFYDSKYSNLISEEEQKQGKIFYEYLMIVFPSLSNIPPKEKYFEVDGNSPCPCGSGKLYKNCCGKKDFKYKMGKDHIVKEIPLVSPLEKSLEEVSKMNEELLGRKDKYHEKIFRTSLGIGEHHHEWIRIGLFFINQILFEFTQIKSLSNFAYRDLNYFSDKMKEKLHSLFQFMIPLNKENEKLYSIFLECTSDWKTLK